MSATAALMGALAFVSVGLWTLRVALTARGRKAESAAVAAIEAVVFALVFSKLVSDLGSWDRIAGYAIGVAVGTIAGLFLNERLNRGGVIVEAVVAGDGAALQKVLHSAGWPATALPATGLTGQATLLFVAVPSERTSELLSLICTTAPDAFWSVRPTTAYRGLPAPATETSETRLVTVGTIGRQS
jgi:uncharacterized protein YebE (UPF0316 family)